LAPSARRNQRVEGAFIGMGNVFVDLLGGRQRLPLIGSLALSVLFSVALIGVRIERTHSLHYGFLLWNLVLALIPLGAVTLARLADRGSHRVRRLALLAVWLLFLPNAPYLVTDLVHLRENPGVPFWYDLALLFSCAWNGLILGLLALHDAHGLVARRRGGGAGWALAALAVGLSGFGVYLGRFPRWNSWDVVTQPRALLADIAHRVVHPMAHARTWAVTVMFSALFGAAYLCFRACAGIERAELSAKRHDGASATGGD
jgi:uncharacterized membrane protein